MTAVAERLAAAIRDARRHTVAGAGHVPQLTHPVEYVATLRSFLAG